MITASDESFLAKRLVQDTQPENAIDLVFNFLEALARHSLSEIDKNTWKHAIAQTMVREENEDISGEIGDINERLIEVMEAAITLLKRQGLSSPEREAGKSCHHAFRLSPDFVHSPDRRQEH